MEQKYFYIIIISETECSSKNVYIATSLKEAEEELMKFKDYYCEFGSGIIKTVNRYFKTLCYRTYRKGKLIKLSKWNNETRHWDDTKY